MPLLMPTDSMKPNKLMDTILRSNQLNCPSCVNNIEMALKNLKGVHYAKVHFNTGRIEIRPEPCGRKHDYR